MVLLLIEHDRLRLQSLPFAIARIDLFATAGCSVSVLLTVLQNAQNAKNTRLPTRNRHHSIFVFRFSGFFAVFMAFVSLLGGPSAEAGPFLRSS
eukprot:1242145-Prymnesium_polylepis.1